MTLHFGLHSWEKGCYDVNGQVQFFLAKSGLASSLQKCTEEVDHLHRRIPIYSGAYFEARTCIHFAHVKKFFGPHLQNCQEGQ